MKSQLTNEMANMVRVNSLLDNAPNYLVGCVIQKRLITNLLMKWPTWLE